MRYLARVLAAATSVLSTALVYADLGDQFAKLLPDDGAAGNQIAYPLALKADDQ